jgi:glycosyltransferase involved in cell wall biosynthesis
MNAEPTSVLRTVPVAASMPRATARDARVQVLQLGPSLDVRGGVTAVAQLICDYLPPYAAIRHVPTMHEGSQFSRALMFARAAHTLSRVLESNQATVVHIHFSSRGSTIRKMLLAQQVIHARQPLIMHAHGGSFDSFHRSLPPFLRRLVNRTMQQANLVIVLSSQWRDFYIRECELAPSQVVVLPNPVRVPSRIPERPRRAEVQFVHLAKLAKLKGSYDLIEAFRALPDEMRARARLVLAGNGDTAQLREMAAGDPGIKVLSWIDTADRDRLLAESDVFALPSYVEGLPMALLEAMAAGLPSITSPVGGIPDCFTDGLEGLMVTPGDIGQLSGCMAKLIADADFRVAAGQRAHVRARNYDVHSYARRLSDYYQRIAPVADLQSET